MCDIDLGKLSPLPTECYRNGGRGSASMPPLSGDCHSLRPIRRGGGPGLKTAAGNCQNCEKGQPSATNNRTCTETTLVAFLVKFGFSWASRFRGRFEPRNSLIPSRGRKSNDLAGWRLVKGQAILRKIGFPHQSSDNQWQKSQLQGGNVYVAKTTVSTIDSVWVGWIDWCSVPDIISQSGGFQLFHYIWIATNWANSSANIPNRD